MGLARLSQNEKIIDTVLDPSAWQNRGDEQNIAEQFEKFSGLMPRKADNDRLSGKLLIQEYLRWNPKPPKFIPPTGFDVELYWRLHRMKGPKAADEYQKLFEPEPAEQLLPKLLFFDTCVGIIDHLPKCIYKLDAGRKSDDNPEGLAEEVAELKNDTDDFYDELRYGLMACQAYLDFGIFEHSKEAKIAKVYENYAKHKDLTMFNIEMDNLEKEKPPKGFKRFNSRGNRLRHANF